MKTKLTFHSFLKARSLKLETSSGFTIVETLVAIAILLMSISAPLTIAEKGLASAETARQEITAFYLAQEAMEYVRNVRDTNALSGLGGQANWLQGLNQCTQSGGCGVDTTAPPPGQQITACNQNNDNCRLSQYTGNPNSPLFGIFGHSLPNDNWTATDFIRRIDIQEIQNSIEARVQITMTWKAGSLGSRTLILSESILNWYDSP